MDFSVIICTYNRAANLPVCLQRLQDQANVTDFQWEVVVVDNNSNDGTAEVVSKFAAKSPIHIRCIREEQQGLNYARNRGALECKGTYFAYIDDDILVCPIWLRSIFDALRDNDADAAGGRIHLDPSLHLPAWMKPEMYGFLGHQDFGEESFRMDGVQRYPFGGNMAFHRRVLEKIGQFNVNLGRKGSGRNRKELFKGAETDYFHRLAASGDPVIVYQPDAIVYHQVLPHQLTKRYFRTIHYNAGYQKAFFDDGEYPRRLFGVPLFLLAQTLRAMGRYLLQAFTRGPDWAFRQQMTVAHFLGMVLGHHRARAEAQPSSAS